MEIRNYSQFERGYVFDRREIESALSPEYLSFLEEAGIGDLRKTPNLFVASHVLKGDEKVNKVTRFKYIDSWHRDDAAVVGISQPNARSLINSLGGIVLPVGLMYRLVIPNLREVASGQNPFARETIREMVEDYAKWLEDLVLDGTRLRIGTNEEKLVLPGEKGWFDRADINEFGYPDRVKKQGEFYYWPPGRSEAAAFRGGGSGLGLLLDGVRSFEVGGLGVRFAKFFEQVL